MSVIPLADLKVHLNITGTNNDAELQDMLDSAEEWVVGQTGIPFSGGNLVYTVHSTDGVLLLPTMAATAVVSVVDPYGYTAVVDTYRSNLASGVLVVRSPRCGNYTVTLTLGSTPSSGLVLATLIIAGHLWETQRGTAPSALQNAALDAPLPGYGYSIPNRARELLLPFVPPAVA